MFRLLVAISLAVLARPAPSHAREGLPWWRPTHVALTGSAAGGASDEIENGEGVTGGLGLALALEAPRWDGALEVGVQDFFGVRGTRFALLGGPAQNLGGATRIALTAEVGLQRYTPQSSEGLLASTRVLDPNSVMLPYVGARASLLWRSGFPRRAVFGLSAFARTTTRHESAVYSYESCGVFGCGEREATNLYGGTSYGLVFVFGAQFALPRKNASAPGVPAISAQHVGQP